MAKDDVIAYYRNPETGKVEKTLLTSASWDDIRFRCKEAHLWSTEKPEKVESGQIIDLIPKPVDYTAPAAKGPPAIERPIGSISAASRGGGGVSKR